MKKAILAVVILILGALPVVIFFVSLILAIVSGSIVAILDDWAKQSGLKWNRKWNIWWS